MDWFLICGVISIIVLIIIAISVFLIKSKRPLRHVWAETIYELYYYIAGSKNVIEDIVLRKRNKADLINKIGKVALITGGTRGIGAEVVKMLLQCNMTVIMGCRNTEAGSNMLNKLRKDGITTGMLYIYHLDISSLNSVSKFTEEIKSKHLQINVLINNAGIMQVPYEETEDGFESIFATNYLGHFFLTHQLLPLIKTGGNSGENARIVNVSSCAYSFGKIDFEDINRKKMFISLQAYSQSKLGQVLYTNYLNRIFLKDEQTNIQVHSVHPGVVNTDIFDDTSLKCLFWWILPYLFKNATQGAMSIIYACIEPELEGKGGTYISNCKIVKQNRMAMNESLQDKFFEFSSKLLESVSV